MVEADVLHSIFRSLGLHLELVGLGSCHTAPLSSSSGRSSEASGSQACEQHRPPDVPPHLFSCEICHFPPFPQFPVANFDPELWTLFVLNFLRSTLNDPVANFPFLLLITELKRLSTDSKGV